MGFCDRVDDRQAEAGRAFAARLVGAGEAVNLDESFDVIGQEADDDAEGDEEEPDED